jgi:hypothetical protein
MRDNKKLPRLDRSIKQTDQGNFTAKISYKGEILWSNCYGKHLYAVMGIDRNYPRLARMIAERERKE